MPDGGFALWAVSTVASLLALGIWAAREPHPAFASIVESDGFVDGAGFGGLGLERTATVQLRLQSEMQRGVLLRDWVLPEVIGGLNLGVPAQLQLRGDAAWLRQQPEVLRIVAPQLRTLDLVGCQIKDPALFAGLAFPELREAKLRECFLKSGDGSAEVQGASWEQGCTLVPQ